MFKTVGEGFTEVWRKRRKAFSLWRGGTRRGREKASGGWLLRWKSRKGKLVNFTVPIRDESFISWNILFLASPLFSPSNPFTVFRVRHLHASWPLRKFVVDVFVSPPPCWPQKGDTTRNAAAFVQASKIGIELDQWNSVWPPLVFFFPFFLFSNG